jgi:hypothetical protein
MILVIGKKQWDFFVAALDGKASKLIAAKKHCSSLRRRWAYRNTA